MFPWLWIWSPQLHFPWSGSVAQQIEPSAFFGAIRPNAGNGRVERETFEEVASYGKQLGLIIEALLGHSGRSAVTPAQADVALERLEGIRRQVEAIKHRNDGDSLGSLVEQLEALRVQQPPAFALLAQRFRAEALPAPTDAAHGPA